MAIYIDFLKMHGNNLKSLASIFQVAIRFHPRHLWPKTLANSFSLCHRFSVTQIYILAVQRYVNNP